MRERSRSTELAAAAEALTAKNTRVGIALQDTRSELEAHKAQADTYGTPNDFARLDEPAQGAGVVVHVVDNDMPREARSAEEFAGFPDDDAPPDQIVRERDKLKEDLGELTKAHEALTESMFEMRRQSMQLEAEAASSRQLRQDVASLSSDTSQSQATLQQLWAEKQENTTKITQQAHQIAALQQTLNKALVGKPVGWGDPAAEAEAEARAEKIDVLQKQVAGLQRALDTALAPDPAAMQEAAITEARHKVAAAKLVEQTGEIEALKEAQAGEIAALKETQAGEIAALKGALESALLRATKAQVIAAAGAPRGTQADAAALEAAKTRNKMAMAKIVEQTREISALRAAAQGGGPRPAVPVAPAAATVVFDRSSNQGLGIQFGPTPSGRGVEIKGIDAGSQVGERHAASA